ncbi:hypothetical protein FF1_005337 [Malus domestica]
MEINKSVLQKLEYLLQEIAESLKEEVAVINNLRPEETYASYLKHLAASTGILGKLDLKERNGHADHVSGDGKEALLDTEDSFSDWVHVIHPVADEFEGDSSVSSAVPPTTKFNSVARLVRYWLGLTADTILSATADILVSVTAAILRIIITTMLDRARALDKLKGILKVIIQELEKINPEIREIVTTLVAAKVMIKLSEEDESEVSKGFLSIIQQCLLKFQKKYPDILDGEIQASDA